MPNRSSPAPIRHLVLILGDQLSLDSAALQNFDPAQDHVLMIEAPGEGTAVWSHKARIALFLSAMRHFCNALHTQRWPYTYSTLADARALRLLSFSELLEHHLSRLKPKSIQMIEAGEWAMQQSLVQACQRAQVPLRALPDTHFMCSRAQFAAWARAKKELRMEFFYRDMRRQHGVLMKNAKEPEGERWNFDADNRSGYPKAGPGAIPPPAHFEPDAITRQVFAEVDEHFPKHPGSLQSFAWPVTREQALQALQQFVQTRLPHFGRYQDAMWTTEPWGWHALISTSLNLHLLNPREVVAAAEEAYRERNLDLASVEGFIRQVLGWREFIRGVYWLEMPHMQEANHFGHQRQLPAWYWSGETNMACMRAVVGQTLAHGYAHHIQRLMVTGQFALLAQIAPSQVCDWYLAVYVDAIDWVERPNTAGMALFATGPRMTSKPYIASGQYTKRMSNYCEGCTYKPEQRSGASACPVTTLYWHFLDTHEAELMRNPRTSLMAKNIARLGADERAAIRTHAQTLLENLDTL
jgi:deoxyribodipyrimidine photolyase-related protein